MRVIPKRTKVRLELFKGIEVVDVLVGAAGVGLSISLLFSNLPGKYVLTILVLILAVAMVVPIDDDKGYLFILYLIRYLGRKREFKKKKVREAEEAEAAEKTAKAIEEAAANGKKRKSPKKRGNLLSKLFPAAQFDVEDITPFTGIDGNYICYGDAYSAVVMSVPSVEFRFFSEHRQNSVIDRCFAQILRTCAMDEVIDLVYKLKRQYRTNAAFVTSDSTLAAIRKLKNDNGYLWQPALSAGEPDRLLGYPVYTSQFVPAIAAGQPVIAFGDMSYYNIGDRGARSFAALH